MYTILLLTANFLLVAATIILVCATISYAAAAKRMAEATRRYADTTEQMKEITNCQRAMHAIEVYLYGMANPRLFGEHHEGGKIGAQFKKDIDKIIDAAFKFDIDA